MNPIEYLISELDIFIKNFSKVRVRYEYDKHALTHLIEVIPNEIYHLDENYALWESEMFDKFVALYPTENICFISDDALVSLENVIYVKVGTDYSLGWTAKNCITFDQLSILLQQVMVKKITNITVANNQKYNFYEDTQVPHEYSSRMYSLAA